ncbi:DUF427 domain-containing protein [Marinovum sp. 2_MG-2023]|uniref:DUF427 domain-containing protein n=1 Tax=Roseobacteraceae TaxID=2854170 RepID=UPI001FD597B6|nr:MULTISPECIES: DUF427 domain-containing protein [Roseobacteraceae]MCJ7872496.1 DUF427 domain-containing protein [Phaeobacter sp. J2-8]MDO6731409.1 DUF427 domain-containing protein [Marinovum sp. 2_MG-2023]MDO6780692.1 DUF427 domain-containing protein [Marinovum sp. 1_MG-2023]
MTIRIVKAEGNWVVRAGGAVLGESSNALELIEDGHKPVIYFPRGDIAMAFLDASDKKTTCPHKGEASYFSIDAKNRTLQDVVWSYEDPKPEVAEIKGYLAFQPGAYLQVEEV